MNLAVPSQPPHLEMVSGGPAGQIFDLAREQISIGRSEDNDIVVVSEAVSRRHAVLEKGPDERWMVRDNQSKNGVVVNGNPVHEAQLQAGDIVQIGNFVFRFNEESGREVSVPQGSPLSMAQAPVEGYGAPARKTRKKPNRRVLIYSVVGLLLAFLYMTSQDSEKKPETPKEGETPTKLARDFKAADAPTMVAKPGEGPPKDLVGIEDPTLKQAEQDMAKLDWTNSSLKEAEQFFRKGQREYLGRNFGRAIESFQTALALFRGHELADKYLRLAIYNAEQEAKRQMEMGVKYFESLQYQRAMYHFSEVITLMAHRPTEAIVTESEKYIVLSRKRLQAAELFP